MFGCCCLAAIQGRGFDFGFATQVFSDPAGFKERDQRFLVVDSGHGRGLEQREALAVGAAFSAGVALLDVQGPDDLTAWLAASS